MWKWVFSLVLMFQVSTGYCLDKRSKTGHYTVSVVIPCHPLHVKYLKRVLQSYAEQTVLPLEAVISISEVYKVSPQEIEEFRSVQWPFQLKVVTSNERLFAGANRNAATAIASGKIILYQDADDIPHKQRVEIIKHYFEKYKISHLMHRFGPPEGPFAIQNLTPKLITAHELSMAQEAFVYFSRIQFGQCAVSRKAARRIQWDPNMVMGEDLKFCDALIDEFHGTILIDAELVLSGTSGIPGQIERGLL